MTRLRRARPSPALVISVLAMVAAVAGTAVAANPTANSSADVTKKQAKKIAKKQAKKQVNKRLPIGSDELAVIDEHTEVVSVPANSHRSITASCEPNEVVISGGFRWLDEGGDQLDVRASHRDGNTWRAAARNHSGSAKEFRVHAYCLTTG